MDERQQPPIGTLGPAPLEFNDHPREVSRLLLLWPFAGFVAIVAAMMTYQPLDDTVLWWVSFAPGMIVYMLINIAWRKARSGEPVPSWLPRTLWLAVGCLVAPIALFLNGALDRSPVERHQAPVTRRIMTHHRGNTYYSLEIESWRADRAHERVTVSERWYLEAKPGDPVVVETRAGALGIPLIVSVHRPD